MCVLAPGANVLNHLEQIGQYLLKADAEGIRQRSVDPLGNWPDGLVAARLAAIKALDGAYDLTDHTLALLRVLELLCSASPDLPADLTGSAKAYLKGARIELQLALFMRLRRNEEARSTAAAHP